MYLKKIDFYGFKSFADRTAIDFANGVFAIVGPNGCGKSNIVDGVRWVLGEQSAKSVRGHLMDDVIFNGSGRRGPLNFAEVTLTLNNESGRLPVPYTEVAVTRRITRGGGCDYFINREAATLREVHNLFMDTGVSRNLYSLIAQGEVGRLAGSSPLERRQLFEEAAGIAKYRYYKRKALNNLEATENDLSLISNVLHEKESHLGSLHRQARKAERAREVHDRLQHLVVVQTRQELDGLAETAARREYQLEQLRRREAELRAEQSTLSAELAGLKQTVTEADLVAERARAAREEQQKRAIALEGELNLAREQEGNVGLRLTELDDAVRAAAGKAEFIRAQQAKVQESLATARAQLGTGETAARALQERATAAVSLLAEVDAARAGQERQLDALEEHTRTRGEQERLLRERESQRQLALDEVNKRAAKVQSYCDTLAAKGSELQRELESRRALQQETVSHLAALQAREAELDDELRTVEGRLGGLERELATVRAELGAQERWLKNHEGCRAGVVKLLEAAAGGELPGLQGILAEQLTLDQRYEAAVDAALGENLQAVLVDGDRAAWAAVRLLNERNLGRATLVWTGAPAAEPALVPTGAGIVGPLLELMNLPPERRAQLHGLLGRVLAVECLAVAHQLRRTGTAAGWHLVTLQGEYWHAGGALTAGPMESSQLIRQNRIINELRDQLRAGSGELGRLQSGRERLESDRAGVRLNRDRVAARGQRLEVDLAGLTTDRQNVERETQGVRAELAELDPRRQHAAEELELLRGQLRALAAPDADDLQSRARFEDELRRLQARRAELDRELGGLRGELMERRVAVAALHEKGDGLARELTAWSEQLGGIIADAAHRGVELTQLRARQAELRGAIARLEAEQRERHAAEREKEEQFVVAFDHVQQLKREFEMKEDALGEQHRGLTVIQEEYHRAELAAGEDKHRRESLRQALRVEFRLDDGAAESALASAPAEPVDATELAELRVKHQQLGTASFEAIDEYRAMQENVAQLRRQRDDLLQAKANLQSTIRRIDRYTRELFQRTFQAINTNFKIVAKRLFDGGDARLELVETDDPNLAGIEVFIRPPGKKLQTLSLYSGGERALISLALLFSVFLVKPSPFCILDEVDAPLDDLNTIRFLKLVREFTNRTQFICITHQPQTMVRSDKLIGITMEERGVSKVVEMVVPRSAEQAGSVEQIIATSTAVAAGSEQTG